MKYDDASWHFASTPEISIEASVIIVSYDCKIMVAAIVGIARHYNLAIRLDRH